MPLLWLQRWLWQSVFRSSESVPFSKKQYLRQLERIFSNLDQMFTWPHRWDDQILVCNSCCTPVEMRQYIRTACGNLILAQTSTWTRWTYLSFATKHFCDYTTNNGFIKFLQSLWAWIDIEWTASVNCLPTQSSSHYPINFSAMYIYGLHLSILW